MKNKKGIWFLIIFLSIVVVAITSGLIIYLTNPNITFSIYQKSEVLEEKSYTLDEINDIKIDVTSSNIKINKQETSNIVIKITGYKKNQFSLNLKQEELEKICLNLYPYFFDYKDITLHDINIKIDDYLHVKANLNYYNMYFLSCCRSHLKKNNLSINSKNW